LCAIIREIIQERLAGDTRNVRVITRDGFVTLKGTVNADYYRRRVGAIAASVVSWNKVDNQVIVVSDGSAR
jgi:osmotically-inducible protein OsmY